MPDPKDKNKMGSVSSNASEQFGTRVIKDTANSENAEIDAALTSLDEEKANNIAIEQQRGKRKPIPSVMDIHAAMVKQNEEKKQQARDKDTAHRAEIQRNPTQYFSMPITKTPAEQGPAPAKPIIKTHGHAAAAAKNEAIRKRSHHADDRRKHATREQRLEAKANRVFNQSKPSDKKSARDIFKESAPSGNIPGKRRP